MPSGPAVETRGPDRSADAAALTSDSSISGPLQSARTAPAGRAVLRGGGREAAGRPVARTPVVGAAVQFDALDLPVGPAVLELTVVPWEGAPRTIEVPVEISPAVYPAPVIRPLAPEMPHEDFARIETLPVGDVTLGERDNPFWIRVSDGEDRAVDAHLEVLLDDVRVSELHLSSLGLGLATVQLTRLNHELKLVAAVTGAEGTLVEDVAPVGLIRIRPLPPVVRDHGSREVTLDIESETVAERRDQPIQIAEDQTTEIIFSFSAAPTR